MAPLARPNGQVLVLVSTLPLNTVGRGWSFPSWTPFPERHPSPPISLAVPSQSPLLVHPPIPVLGDPKLSPPLYRRGLIQSGGFDYLQALITPTFISPAWTSPLDSKLIRATISLTFPLSYLLGTSDVIYPEMNPWCSPSLHPNLFIPVFPVSK